jgi:hypothetical protein
MICGGLVGAFFITLAAGAVDRRALSPLYLAVGAGLGALAVWQSVVGTYLFVVTRNRVNPSK